MTSEATDMTETVTDPGAVIASVVARIDGLDGSQNVVDYGWVTPVILAALAEAGFVIVARDAIENVIDVAEFGQKRLDAGHYGTIIDACRDILAARPDGAR